jgi:hypothetical protein
MSTVLSKFDYELAADGMRKQVVETMAESRTIDYTYDDLNRMTEEDAYETGSGYNYGYDAQYTYDLAGNRTTRYVTVTYFEAGYPDRQQKITTTYGYYSDDNGETDRLHTESHSITQISMVLPDEQIYAYASGNGDFHYTKGFGGKPISQLRAMFLGLPTKLGSRLFYAAMALLAVAFFAPVLARGCAKLRKRRPEGPRIHLGLWHRCVSVLLAYIMLIGPFGFEQLARADIQYQTVGRKSLIPTYTICEIARPRWPRAQLTRATRMMLTA